LIEDNQVFPKTKDTFNTSFNIFATYALNVQSIIRHSASTVNTPFINYSFSTVNYVSICFAIS